VKRLLRTAQAQLEGACDGQHGTATVDDDDDSRWVQLTHAAAAVRSCRVHRMAIVGLLCSVKDTTLKVPPQAPSSCACPVRSSCYTIQIRVPPDLCGVTTSHHFVLGLPVLSIAGAT